jgi:hypothetical protein
MSGVIGVFGDSYACRDEYHKASWVDVLENKFNHKIECYGHTSTSLFWSYKQFMKHKNKCSKIILSITTDNRLYTSSTEYPLGSLFTVERLLDGKYKPLQKNNPMYPAVLAAQGYYKYLLEPEYCRWVQSKLLAEIIDICQKESKQLILMPMHRVDMYCQNIFTVSLHDITLKENHAQFGEHSFKQEKKNERPCHMSEKNNLIMATLLNEILEGKQRKISLSDFVFEKIDNPELYWHIE